MRFTLLDLSPWVIVFIVICLRFSITSPSEVATQEEPVSSGQNDMAFATLTTPAFCMGAVTVGHLLKKYHGDKYDRICLVTPDVNDTWAEVLSQWWRVIRVPNYKPFPGFRRSWAKLYLWSRTEYKKLVYMDTDMLVLGPLDELFDYPMLSCVPDPQPPQICNTGVLVIEPREGLTDDMKRVVKEKKLFHGVGDQSFINSYFGGFTPLPPKYNSPRVAGGGLGKKMKANSTKIVHYVCKKPWKCGREGVSYCGCGYPRLNEVWWQVWDEACKDHICMETWVEGNNQKKKQQ